MKDRLPLVLALVLLVPALLLANAPVALQRALPAPEPQPSNGYVDFNDGWTDIIPVPMQGKTATGDRLRERNNLDAFDSTVVLDEFEGVQAAWTSEDLTDVGLFWHLEDTLAFGGSGVSWACMDPTLTPGLGGGYNDHWLQFMVLDTFSLAGAANPTFSLQARWKMETPGGESPPYDMWDGWNAWISTNNGATWSVLTSPSVPYTGQNAFSFGDIWGYGPGIPAYGGTAFSTAFTPISWSLAAYAGQSNVLIRIAFCSDDGFSAINDSSLYGLVVDQIRVMDGATTILANDGTLDEIVLQQGPTGGDSWIIDTATNHSPTRCWTAGMGLSQLSAITSYPITLPTGYNQLTVRYWVWADMPDSDGDNDNSLEDYYDLWVVGVDTAITRQVVYDYAYNDGAPSPGGNSLTDWVFRTRGLTSGGVQVPLIELTPFAGKTVRLLFRMRTDANHDGGMGGGLHIDDVQVVATRAYATDMASRNLVVPFPTTVGLARPYSYQLVNEGLNNLGNQLRHRLKITKPDNTIQGVDSNLVTVGTLTPGDDTTVARIWTPQMAGSHVIRVACNYVGELDRTNDTTYSPTNVPLNPDSNFAVTVQPAGVYELGYHMRDKAVSLINPRYLYYTPVADGVPAAQADTFDITAIKVMWNFDPEIADIPGGALARIEFWEAGPDARTPGALINRIETRIDTTETIGALGRNHWWTLNLAGIPGMAGRRGNFWVSISGMDTVGTNGFPHLLAKTTTPQDTTDGHSFTKRLDLPGAPILASPSRFLVQVTIVPTTTTNPARVADVVATRVGTTNDVQISWTPPARANGYYVYRLTNPSHSPSQGVRLNDIPVAGTNYVDANALSNPNVKYFYAVIAIN